MQDHKSETTNEEGEGKEKEKKSLGFVLYIWLTLVVVSTALMVVLFAASVGANVSAGDPDGLLVSNSIRAGLSLIQLVTVFFIYYFKKWPIYVFIAIAIAVFVLNIVEGFEVSSALIGLLSPAVLLYLMKRKWELFG